MAIAFVAAWIFFPRQIIFLRGLYNRTITQAPPGTHLSPDGKLCCRATWAGSWNEN